MVIIQSQWTEGTATLTATAKGVQSASVSLNLVSQM